MSRPDAFPYVYPERRQSVIGTFFKCLALIAVTGIVCGTGVVMGTLGIANGRIGTVLRLADHAIDDLPATLRNAAPILADATKDRRDPAYAALLAVNATVSDEQGDDEEADTHRRSRRHEHWDTGRAVVEIHNRGDKVVSVLALRVVSLGASDRPITDRTVYGATPLAIENEWRGPLLPGSTRKIVVRCPSGTRKIETEIAEVRVWDPSIESPAKKVAENGDDRA